MVKNQAAVVRDSPFSCFILYLITRKKVEPAPGGGLVGAQMGAISAPCVITMDGSLNCTSWHTLCAKAKKQNTIKGNFSQ